MKGLKFFYTITEPGNPQMMLLLFPPTTCLSSKVTFGNSIGIELRTQKIDTENVSVIEIFPFCHEKAAKKFDQDLFSQFYLQNEMFQTAINKYIKNYFDIVMAKSLALLSIRRNS
jgi:hypothetical protein